MRLAKYLKPYWWLAILAPLTMIGEVVIDLSQPSLMASIVDDGVLGGNMRLIIVTGLKMLLLVACGGCCGILSGAFSITASQSFANDLRRDLYKRVMSFSFEQTDNFTIGSLITRLTNDVTAVADFVGSVLRMFVRAPVFFIGGIIMMLTLNVKFGLVMIVSMPIQLTVVILVFKKVRPLFRVMQEKLDRLNSKMREDISGARIIKSLVREDQELERFHEANEDLLSTSYTVQHTFAFFGPALSIIMNFSVVAIIFIGGLQVEARNMQVGEVMAAITYIAQVLGALMMLTMTFMNITRASVSASRILEVLDTIPAIKDGGHEDNDPIESITFENVTFAYPGSSGVPAVKNINLEIKGGEKIAILGATGSGKSSLVQLIPRFYDVTEGTIRINGRDVREYNLENLRDKIGYVLQSSNIFSGTVLENINYGNTEHTEEEGIAAAHIAQVHEYIGKFNEGYHTAISEKGTSLSGGQKQRIAIARALVKKPPILIFDDSTSALDFKTEARLRSELNAAMENATVITIAQRIASVLSADRIVVLDNGEIVAVGPHSELIKTSAVYKDIYDSQIREDAAL
ncbi:MAG: ABC transporter ATP-binding protein/permease [Clostridia bacterium]|nr:ABC transporter ATP-binding protein/permease [Clostridia bacterium]